MIKKVKQNTFNEFSDVEIARVIRQGQRLLAGQSSYGNPTALPFGQGWQAEAEKLLGPENQRLIFDLVSRSRNKQPNPDVLQLVVAYLVAEKAHDGQVQKANRNQPYIDHPRHVASQFLDPDTMQIAILHDVLEGSNFKREHLEVLGFKKDVLDDLELLTRKETLYLDYVRNLAKSERARLVKMEDIKHNMRPDRAIPHKDIPHEKFILKQEAYRISLAYIEAVQAEKISPEASMVEFLTTAPYGVLIGTDTPVAEWSGEQIREKAEELYIIRQTLMQMSEVEVKSITFLDHKINELVAEGRLPPPKRPRTAYNANDNDAAPVPAPIAATGPSTPEI